MKKLVHVLKKLFKIQLKNLEKKGNQNLIAFGIGLMRLLYSILLDMK